MTGQQGRRGVQSDEDVGCEGEMAGGGVKPGFVYGQTDELGYHAVKNRVDVHDLQATILHCLGLDHLRLTFRHKSRDFRLTDVAGNVIHDVLL